MPEKSGISFYEVASLFMKGMGQEAKDINVTRVDGAYEAEMELARLVWEKQVEMISMKYDFWNFSRDKGYLMCMYYLKKL